MTHTDFDDDYPERIEAWEPIDPKFTRTELAIIFGFVGLVAIVGLYLALPYFREAGTAALLLASASQ